MNARLNEVISKARAAVTTAKKGRRILPVLQEGSTTPHQPTRQDLEAVSAALEGFEPTLTPLPDTYTIDPVAKFADADDVAAGRAERLSKGALRLWQVLHGAAVQVAAYRGYSAKVSQVTLALPQSAVAALLGYDARHVRRLQSELEQAGLIDAGAWAARVDGRHMWATTLWAVKTGAKNTTPRLTADDYRANWRDLAADLKAKNTVQRAMSGLNTQRADSEICDYLAVMHVTGRFSDSLNPLLLVRTFSLGSVQDAINSISLLADAAKHERRELVQQLAGWLSDSLNDRHSFRFWCSLLWPCAGKWEACGALQAQLSRLLADLREWDGIRSPAAWFTARLQT